MHQNHIVRRYWAAVACRTWAKETGTTRQVRKTEEQINTHHIAIRRCRRRRAHSSRLHGRPISPILAPTTLDRPAVHHLTLQLNDRHSSMLVCVKLDKRKATISLHANFGKIADRLEQRNEVRLGAVGDQVTDINCRVVGRRLLDNGLIGEGTTLEVDWCRCSAEGSGGTGRRCRSSLGFLICPVDTDGTRAEPFPVHGGDGLFSVCLVPEREEAVTTRFSGIHIPHHTSIGQGAKGAESLAENLVIDFGGEIADEDVVMTGGVFLVLLTLVSPVDTNFRVENFAAVEGLQSGLCSTHVEVLDETIVEAAMLVVTVRDDFNMLDWASDGKDLREHVLGDPRAQVADIEMGAPLVDGRSSEEGKRRGRGRTGASAGPPMFMGFMT